MISLSLSTTAAARKSCTARRPRILQPHDVGRSTAGRQLPVALLLGRRSAAMSRPTRSSGTRTRRRPSSSSRAASTSRSRGSGAPRPLRGNSFAAPHIAGVAALGREAPRADPVPAEERSAPDRDQRRGCAVSEAPEARRAAAAAGMLGGGEDLPRAAAVDRRRRADDLRGRGRLHLHARRGHRRARLRGGLRAGRGELSVRASRRAPASPGSRS